MKKVGKQVRVKKFILNKKGDVGMPLKFLLQLTSPTLLPHEYSVVTDIVFIVYHHMFKLVGRQYNVGLVS